MADITQLYAGPGPLPIQVQFQNEIDGPVALYMTGSAFEFFGNSLLSASVSIDGNVQGTMQVFTNEAYSHKAFVPVVASALLSVGPHTLTIEAGSNTVTDGNDFFVVDLIA